MPFNTLLLSCLEHGTSVSQSGVSVHVRPKKGETILFFRTDCDIARKDLNIQSDEPVCDYLVFYHTESRIVLCFLELKGNHTEHAIKQVLSTCEHLKWRLQELQGKECWSSMQRITWKAYIRCGNKSTISPTKQYAKKIAKFFSKDFKVTHEDELDSFLRK